MRRIARATPCAGYCAVGDDLLPVRALLEIAYTCHARLKQGIEAQLRGRDDNGGVWPETTVEPDPGRVVLGHVWRVDNALQCLMVQRAVEIRDQSFQTSLLPFGQPSAIAAYVVSDEDRAREQRCIEPYRDDAAFGAAANGG